jgi:hypothetical protein
VGALLHRARNHRSGRAADASLKGSLITASAAPTISNFPFAFLVGGFVIISEPIRRVFHGTTAGYCARANRAIFIAKCAPLPENHDYSLLIRLTEKFKITPKTVRRGAGKGYEPEDAFA